MMAGVGLSADELQRAAPIISGFLLGYIAVLPLIGRIADVAGRTPVLVGALVLFAVGSLITAGAYDLPLVVTGRFLQGVGGGGLVPATLALVADLWPAERRGLPLGVVGAVQELGSVLGPLLGAAVLAVADWRYIFWLNLVVAVVLALLLRGRWRPRISGAVGLLACIALGLTLTAPDRLASGVTLGLPFVPFTGDVPAAHAHRDRHAGPGACVARPRAEAHSWTPGRNALASRPRRRTAARARAGRCRPRFRDGRSRARTDVAGRAVAARRGSRVRGRIRALAASYGGRDRAPWFVEWSPGVGFAGGQFSDRMRADRGPGRRTGVCSHDAGRRSVGGRSGAAAVPDRSAGRCGGRRVADAAARTRVDHRRRARVVRGDVRGDGVLEPYGAGSLRRRPSYCSSAASDSGWRCHR